MASNSAITPPVSAIPGLDTQINDLNNQAGALQSKINSSPTSFSDLPPTQGDISNQDSLTKIQTSIKSLNDQKLRAQWYPQKSTTPATVDSSGEGAVDSGLIGTSLDYLTRPIRGIVGATQHFTGQGTDSLTNDIANNMTTGKAYFGDVLAKAGAPGWLAAPLGFGLDVALDPVNWATMGEAALVPKVAGGLFRGGIEGAGIAAKAGVLEKAVKVSNLVPGFGTAFGEGANAFKSLGSTALDATHAYETMSGNTAEKLLSTGGGAGIGSYRIPLTDVVNQIADVIPGGQKVLSTLVYDPVGWLNQAIDIDTIKRTFGTEGVLDIAGALKARQEGKSILPFLKQASENAAQVIGDTKELPPGGKIFTGQPWTEANTAAGMAALPPDVLPLVQKAVGSVSTGVDNAISIAKDPTIGVVGDPLENVRRILNEQGVGGGDLTLDHISQIVKSGALGDTGLKWFDDMMQGINGFKAKVDANGKQIGGIGQSALEYYDRFMTLFRGGKVGGSPVAHMNAIFGTAIMNHLGIGDIGVDYWTRYKQIHNLMKDMTGTSAGLENEYMKAGLSQVLQYLKDNPTGARGILGDTSWIGAKASAQDLLQKMASDAGKITKFNPMGLSADDIAPYVDQGKKDFAELYSKFAPDVADQFGLKGVKSGTTQVRSAYAARRAAEIAGEASPELTRMDVPTDMVSQELFGKKAGADMLEAIAQKAKDNPSNPFWWAMDTVYNKMTNTYAKHEQEARLTTFVRSTLDGYSIPQLLKARNLIDIGPEDFTKIVTPTGERYRLSAEKGLELSTALYMNYSAMPSAIRMLRNFPLIGSPFASFMYGMALKTGQALAYNPEAFNKVNFAMSEFGGSPTALEKQALNTPFYSYLKKPGMYRVPFTDANPIYLNLSSMIPYYSLNMFNPSQQNYQVNSLSTALVQAVDSSPFLKEPLGAVMFNNLIQPAILGEAIQPQSQFGQAIWPSDADFFAKLGYTARDLAEAAMPGVASYAGLAGGLAVPGATPYVPLYRYRTLANAVQGNNVYGISGKESIPSRTLRGILSASGIPVQAPVNTTFSPTTAAPSAP